MKRNLVVYAALATLAVPAVCRAIPIHPGPYVSGFIGVSGLANTTASTTDFTHVPAIVSNDEIKFDPSINVGGTGGFDFGMVRLEGEVSYKQGDISSVNIQTGQTNTQIGNTDGTLGAFAMMINSFIDLHNNSPVTPYIGGGIGFAVLYLSDTFGTNVNGGTPISGTVFFQDNDTVFAYQAGAGLEIALNRRLSLDLGYRYFATSNASFNNTPISTSMKFESHNGAVGLRAKF
jgi:opacity protein-like surface antigen